MATFLRSLEALRILILILEIYKSTGAYSTVLAKKKSLCGSWSRPLFHKQTNYQNCPSGSFYHRPNLTRLNMSATSVPCTAMEVLEMKRLVLEISSERDDERRRNHVSKWMTHQAERKDFLEGIKMLHLWDKTVTELGEDFQHKLRKIERTKSKPCSARLSEGELKKKKDENQLTLWVFVDLLVQTKTLLNRLEVPRPVHGNRLHYQRIQYKLDRENGKEGVSNNRE